MNPSFRNKSSWKSRLASWAAGAVMALPAGPALAQTTLVNANFNAGTDGFAYLDDALRGTAQPLYAAGAHLPSGGFAGGGLQVNLGGVNNNAILNISGGWRAPVIVPANGGVQISFRYRLSLTAPVDTDEYGEMLVRLGASQPGTGANDYVARLSGNGATAVTSGWQVFAAILPAIPAGTLDFTLGGFFNKKTTSDEVVEVVIDDLLLQALPVAPANGLLRQAWTGITGGLVTNLTANANYPNNPNATGYLSIFEGPSAWGDNYGSRVRGYITPPTTGLYTFWIAGDDNSELWLGTDANPSSARLIASVATWTNSREWTKFPQQQSGSISLVGGQSYYVEALHKEGTGGDNIAVGWQGPGITGEAERPIPTGRLKPWTGTLPIAPPVITTPPANQTVNQGQTATFTVVATGTAPLTYQWRRNGVNIAGAAASSYTTPPAAASDNGVQFDVVVSNGGGSSTSSAALLTVVIPPSITAHPANRTVIEGQSAAFSVTATGTAPLAYQWTRNGASIPGAASPTYTLPAASLSDNGVQFRVSVTNAAGSVTSNPATLSVTPAPPVITTQPASRSVLAGQTAAFSVTVTSGAPVTYQWRLNGSAIPGANAAAYTTPPTTLADDGKQFSVAVSNAGGSVTSAVAILTVTAPPAPPVIVTQPMPRMVRAGLSATFTVAANGAQPLSYAWRKNGAAIAGANAASYSTPPASAADNGALFDVVVSNLHGSVASNTALLTVVPEVPANRKLAISGELVDESGNPVGYPEPAEVDAVIRLMDAAVGGTVLYTERFLAANSQAITVKSGLFVARLGEGATSDDLQQTLSTHAELWVEITIDDGTPEVLVPRTPLTAAAYSLGGVPAAQGLQVLQGTGNPNTLGIQAAIGATYVDRENNTTWFRIRSSWKLMD